jgi:nitroimidazol reductase NimA-like FMN-containing flavoprotein (pyridoxamine 5'-phosphate oxidase superfamily)
MMSGSPARGALSSDRAPLAAPFRPSPHPTRVRSRAHSHPGWGRWTLPCPRVRIDDEDVSLIHELSYDDCERLLRAGVFGRIVLNRPTGPEIVPVNYTVAGDAVLVRTAPGTVLDKYAGGAPLVFEVDHANYERWHGWSVVARGLGERLLRDQLTEEERRAPRPPPWVARNDETWIRLQWVTLTGRRLGEGWSPAAEMPVRRVATKANWD